MKKNIIRAAFPILCWVFVLPFIWACTSSQDEASAYFESIVKQAEARQGNIKEITTISRRELEKYHQTGDDKFLIGSKYTNLYSFYAKYSTDPDEIVLRQLPLLYEILSLNNGKYKYINIICNYGFSFSFEHNSPKLAMQFVDQGITEELKPGKQYFLPHLYHLKGRLYYNEKDYKNALIYFEKSLTALKKKDVLYVASMHNNFGMCYHKMGRFERAVQEAEKAVSILKTIKKPTVAENDFYQSVNVNLGRYHYKLKNFSLAESIIAKEFEFYKDNPKFRHETATCSRYLFDIYRDTGQIYKMENILSFIQSFEPHVTDIEDKIHINETVQSYYASVNNNEKIKELSYKLLSLHEKADEENKKNFANVSDVLNGYVIKSINQRYEHQLEDQKVRNRLMFVSIFLLVSLFCFIFVMLRIKYRKDKELAAKEKIILQKTKTILENNIRLQEDKISNLHLNLNLKVETEKEFLEHIKKVKRSKNIDAEQTISDLFFKINNLIQIDKKNYDLINESSLENKQFTDNLSARFPGLTQQELKYCVYFKLELSSKEISLLENITEGSARVYKTKIKTKMDLGKDTDLNSFLKAI